MAGQGKVIIILVPSILEVTLLAPLQRRDIVNGKYEPTDEECVCGAGEDEEEEGNCCDLMCFLEKVFTW